MEKKIVAVNGWFLSEPYTGIGQYTHNLLKNFNSKNLAVESSDKLARYNWRQAGSKLREVLGENVELLVITRETVEKELAELSGIKYLEVPEKKILPAGSRKIFWEQIQIPKILKKLKITNIWLPYPATLKFFAGNQITSVHDCTPWRDKRYHNGALSALKHKFAQDTLKKAATILTVSETSKTDIVATTKIYADKVKVIFNGADPVYSAGPINSEILKKHQLTENKYFLYLGGYDPRKNVQILLNQWQKFQSGQKSIFGEFEDDLKLVLAGRSSREFLKKNRVNKVIATDSLPIASIADLYRSTRKFINLSSDEGFNLPVLEALNSGAKVLISDIAVHKELYGGVAGVEFVNLADLK